MESEGIENYDDVVQFINNVQKYGAKSVAETIIHFAKKMGITTIAEFVSDEGESK